MTVLNLIASVDDKINCEVDIATVFSQIDLQSAYHQLPLAVESRNLTVFPCHEGLYRFTRVPYGLASAPATFQKMMNTLRRSASLPMLSG